VKRKSFVIVFFILTLILSGCIPTPTSSPEPTALPTPTAVQRSDVVLTLASWRKDDAEQMNRILSRFNETHPGIIVQHEPFNTDDINTYTSALEAEFKAGQGPDLLYLASYSISYRLYTQGLVETIDGLPGLHENFSPEMLEPWSSQDGQHYGVPFIATSHGIYYNQDAFKKLNLPIPETWEELLQTAQAVQDAGLIPFANGSADGWPMAEVVFMNLAPNFIGGREGRMAYINGQRCLNDSHMVDAFQAIKDIAPFLPPQQGSIGYSDSLQLFLQGRALMWFGGSWDIPFFESQSPSFDWSVFAVPPPAGQPGYVTFHLDAGVGLNAASKHKEQVLEFLSWLTTPEAGSLLANELPGFFPMQNVLPQINNAHAQTFLDLNQGRDTDVRLVWEKLSDGTPSAYDLVQYNAIAVAAGKVTPKEAADAVQEGMAQWYAPAQTCK